MYNLYLSTFNLLLTIGPKKTTVRLIRRLHTFCHNGSNLSQAICEFDWSTQPFELCHTQDCYHPILSDDDPFHQKCRELAAIEAEVDAYLDSRCKQHGCWEDAVKDGYCQQDWEYNFLCSNCGKLESECHGDCEVCSTCGGPMNDCWGNHPELDDDFDDRDDDYPNEDDMCDGICGQPAYACTCTETESLRRHNADPATRGSYWVA